MEQEKTEQVRFYEIDLLRFIAAITVVFYHYTFIGYNLAHLSPVRYECVEPITKYFYLGVELFFVISGYVILRSAHNKTVKQFFVSRVTRLYPVFWVACTLTFLTILLFGPKPQTQNWSEAMHVTGVQYVVNMTMFQHFLGYNDIDGVYWTLAIEISFYFLISLLIAYKIFKQINVLVAVWLLYTAATQLSIAVKTPFHYLLIPEYSPFFIAGMLFYMLQNRMIPLWQIYGLLFASLILGAHSAWSTAQNHALIFHQTYSMAVVVLIIIAIYLVFWLIVKRKVDMRRFAWLNWLGGITYPLYLLHGTIGYILFQRINTSLNKYYLLLDIISLILLVSYLVHLVIEKKLSILVGRQVDRILLYLDR